MSKDRITTELARWFGKDTRYALTIASTLLIFLLLLFIDKLPDQIRSYLLPSLIFYLLCATFVSWLHTMFSIRDGAPISSPKFRSIVALHFALIVCLVWYNWWCGVL